MNDFDKAQEHARRAFAAIPRPKAIGDEFNVWQLASGDGVVLRRLYTGPQEYSDSYFGWIIAKILKVNPRTAEAKDVNRRFALGFRLSGDEFDRLYFDGGKPGDGCGCLLCERIRRAVACFADFAEEMDEGGAFPEARIGRAFPPAKADAQEAAA